MTLLKLLPSNATPPDKFRYTFREDGFTVLAMDRDSWLRMIKQHYKDNEYPMPENWIELAEDQLCKLLPPGHCTYEDGSPQKQFVDARIGFHDVVNGTRVLVEFAKQGAPLVDQATAEDRAATCAACFYNIQSSGCGSCLGLLNIVEEVAAGRKTKADAQLAVKSCAICKCISRAHIWLPIDVLEKGIPNDMLSMFPEFCWKGQGIKEMRGIDRNHELQ